MLPSLSFLIFVFTLFSNKNFFNHFSIFFSFVPAEIIWFSFEFFFFLNIGMNAFVFLFFGKLYLQLLVFSFIFFFVKLFNTYVHSYSFHKSTQSNGSGQMIFEHGRFEGQLRSKFLAIVACPHWVPFIEGGRGKCLPSNLYKMN